MNRLFKVFIFFFCFFITIPIFAQNDNASSVAPREPGKDKVYIIDNIDDGSLGEEITDESLEHLLSLIDEEEKKQPETLYEKCGNLCEKLKFYACCSREIAAEHFSKYQKEYTTFTVVGAVIFLPVVIDIISRSSC